MPRANQISTIPLPGWDGGLNTDADEFQLEPNESPDCMNVDFGLRGAISKRLGYTRYDVSATTNIYTRLLRWNQRGGGDWLLALGSATIGYSSGTTFADQATTWAAATADDGEYFGSVSYDAILYVSTKRGSAYSFDGATFTEISDNVLDGDAGDHFPKAAQLETNYERVWAANLFDGATEHPSRVWFSTIGDPTTWALDDWIDVDPDDGRTITALKTFGGNMMVFKNRGVYSISGSDVNTFTLFPLDSDIGTNAPRTVVSEGDRLIFFDPLTGVWQFDGSGFEKLDDKINLHLLQGINFGASHRSSAMIYQGKYYLSVPWGSDAYPSRTFVFDLRNGAWTQYDYGSADWELRDNSVYGVGVRNLAGVYRMLNGLTDNGTAIAMYAETSWLAPENESVKQRLRRADFAFSALSSTNVTVILKRNFDVDATFTKVVSTDPGGSLWGTLLWGDPFGQGVDQVYKLETGWPLRWRVMQLRFEEASLTGQFQLNRVMLHVSSQSRVRGEV